MVENDIKTSISELVGTLGHDYAKKQELENVQTNLASELQHNYSTISSTRAVGMEINGRIQELLAQLQEDQNTFAELRA